MKFFSVLPLSIILLSSISAHAFNQHFSPLFCEVFNAQVSDYSVSGGSISNLSTTSDLLIRCPIVRNASVDVTTTLQVIDNNPSEDFRCAAYASLINGTGFSGRLGFSSGASSTYQVITIATTSSYRGQPWKDMYVECRIPKRIGSASSGISRFLNYSTREF